MNILVSTDGSERSLSVLPHAARLANALDARIVLCRVIDPRVDAAGEVTTDLEEAVARVQARWMAGLKETLEAAGIEGEGLVPQRIWSKGVEDAIHGAADETSAVALAISTRGAGALRHALMGSVAMGVISQADLPVMTLGDRAEAPGGADGTYHILVTSDGSADSLSVFGGLKRLLVAGRVRVTLFQAAIMAAQEPESAARERACAHLSSLAPRIPSGVDVSYEVCAVPASSRIDLAVVEAARAVGADAIASATHGHSAKRHVVAGSVALGVLKESPVPVILIKSRAVD